MRVGLTRQTSTRRRAGRIHALARGDVAATGAAAAAVDLGPVEMSEPVPAPMVERRLDDERRLRAAGGPKDRAHYHCGCGYAFEANVSTSVACPHCGAGQAW
jgi:hypothetical protein